MESPYFHNHASICKLTKADFWEGRGKMEAEEKTGGDGKNPRTHPSSSSES